MLYDIANKQQAIFCMLARFGEAMSSPKRLKIISLLSEGPKSVEQLADMTDQSVAAASAHRSTDSEICRDQQEHLVYQLDKILDKMAVGTGQPCDGSPHNEKIGEWKKIHAQVLARNSSGNLPKT